MAVGSRTWFALPPTSTSSSTWRRPGSCCRTSAPRHRGSCRAVSGTLTPAWEGHHCPTVPSLLHLALLGSPGESCAVGWLLTPLPHQEPTVNSALKCLGASPTENPYTQALLAYVFGLAGLREQQEAQLGSAAAPSLPEGQLYWQRKGKAQEPSEPSWAAAAPAEVEMTAYVLLAYLSQPSVSPAELGTASRIVRWLCKQQNPYGGFASTQDTVVALQALAKYAALTYGDNGDFTVTVTSPTGTVQDFVLDSSNRLVLQRAALAELPGTYRLQTRGQGCALVQVGTAWAPSAAWHTEPPFPAEALGTVGTGAVPGLGRTGAARREGIAKSTLWLCTCRYSGERPATNMVVIEVRSPHPPLGYHIPQLKRQNLVKKVEVQPDQVTIYLDKEEKTFSFRAQQDFLVSNLQPATVSLYDYYETGEPCRAVSPAWSPAAHPCPSSCGHQDRDG
uniref:Alpha-macroglobulin receptor-binding domain-containing protein n=1 Tax=Catharus ustulatus TaxID=91951 RepID=A0A8C3UEH7_CATUS